MARSLAAAAALWTCVWTAAAGQSRLQPAALQQPSGPVTQTPQTAPSEATAAAQAAAPDALTAQITSLLSAAGVARAHWGIMVTAMDGTPLAALHEGELFQPASNAKLFTTAAAMALLGPNQRFTTRVEYGSVGSKTKTVKGDVSIIGAGDGLFGDQQVPYLGPAASATSPPLTIPPLHLLAEFADQIASSGVKQIEGDIVGDDTVFPWEPYPEDWSIDDMTWGYGAPVSGLTVDDNEVQLTVLPGRKPTEKPTVEFQTGFLAYYTVDTSGLRTGPRGSGDHIGVERAVGFRTIRVYGAIASGSAPHSDEIAISDPAEFAAIALKALLEQRGVKVTGAARANHRLIYQGEGFLAESRQPLPNLPTQPTSPALSSILTGQVSCSDACPVILQHTSPTVAEDVVITNKTSQNLHAELLLHHLGKTFGAPYLGGTGGVDGSTAEGARVVRQFLINAGIDSNDFVFYDGSGLSGHDLVTPRATARLLAFAATQPWFAQWKASLPVGGVDGSLGSRFKDTPLAGHVFAKTGTLGEARALSGYLDCASGRTVIFSIMVGDFVPGTPGIRDTMDQIVAAIAAAE